MITQQTGLYWILLAAGGLLSACLFVLSARRKGFPAGKALAGFLAGLPCAFLLSKAVWILLDLAAAYPEGPVAWFRPVPGEFSFVAGCAGFCLGPALVFRSRRDEILDCLALPGCLLIAFARFGEIFCGALGLADVYTLGLPDIREGSLLARFPFSAADAWGVRYLAVSTLAAGAALAIALFAVIKQKSRDRLPAGCLFERCALLLCAVRLFLEPMRMESLVFYFVHVDQALAALLLAGLMIQGCLRQRKETGRFPAAPLVLTLLCLAVNGLAQYMMDKLWQFEPFLPEGVFQWISGHLGLFGFSLILIASACPAVIHGHLVRKR